MKLSASAAIGTKMARPSIATKTQPGAGRRISSSSCATGSAARSCVHCGLPVPHGARHVDFCCTGCEAVHGLLRTTGLQRFYDLGGGKGQPIGEVPRLGRRDWLPELERRGQIGSGQVSIRLDVQGIHCAACVWLLEELWRRCEGALRIDLNPSLGQATLVYDAATLSLPDYLDAAERLGYRMAPSSKTSSDADRGLLMRTGICVALALNAMLFALAGYLGMTQVDGPAYQLFQGLSFGLSTLAVAVGGPVFFRGALAGLRKRLLHFDLPISLGIVLAWGGSVSCFFSGRGDSYFDTVTVFVALMLIGRTLQQRALRRNRDYLLANDGAEHLRTRVLRDGALHRVPIDQVVPGDRLRLLPGDLVPVRARSSVPAAAFSLDWINGESEPTHNCRSWLTSSPPAPFTPDASRQRPGRCWRRRRSPASWNLLTGAGGRTGRRLRGQWSVLEPVEPGATSLHCARPWRLPRAGLVVVLGSIRPASLAGGDIRSWW